VKKGADRKKAVVGPTQQRTFAEAFAKKAVERGDVRRNVVEHALSLANVPLSANRQNVIPTGQKAIRGAVCGLYVYSQNVGVTNFGTRHSWLTRLLCAFCRKANPSFSFTSIQVNVNYAARAHVDGNNLGPSMITGLGKYKGGALWVHDVKGKVEYTLSEDIKQNVQYKKGASFKGIEKDISKKWCEFNGTRLHLTRPFHGTRYSLVYFVCDRYAETPAKVCAQLTEGGFNFKWGSAKLEKMLTTKRTERKETRNRVTKERFSMHRGVVPFLTDDDRLKYEAVNPKLRGSAAHKRYEKYKKATTLAQARKLGSMPIDFCYDYNQGFLRVASLQLSPASWDIEVRDAEMLKHASKSAGSASSAARKRKVSKDGSGVVPVRVAEMNTKHGGVAIPRAALAKLQNRVERLQGLPDEKWVADNGPFANVELAGLRVALHWAATGLLRYDGASIDVVHDMLAGWGEKHLARLVDPHRSKAPWVRDLSDSA